MNARTLALGLCGLMWPFSAQAADDADPRATLQALEQRQGDAATELLQKARAAFTRADRLRAVGDAVRASLAESVGAHWTAAASQFVELQPRRTATVALEQRQTQAQSQLARARAALEDAFAREQQLRAKESVTTPRAATGKGTP